MWKGEQLEGSDTGWSETLHCLLLIVNGRASLLWQLDPKWSLTALSGSLSSSVAGQESGWFHPFHLQIAGVRSWNLHGNKKKEREGEKENQPGIASGMTSDFFETLVKMEHRNKAKKKRKGSKEREKWQTKVWTSQTQNKHVRKC